MHKPESRIGAEELLPPYPVDPAYQPSHHQMTDFLLQFVPDSQILDSGQTRWPRYHRPRRQGVAPGITGPDGRVWPQVSQAQMARCGPRYYRPRRQGLVPGITGPYGKV